MKKNLKKKKVNKYTAAAFVCSHLNKVFDWREAEDVQNGTN